MKSWTGRFTELRAKTSSGYGTKVYRQPEREGMIGMSELEIIVKHSVSPDIERCIYGGDFLGI